MHDPVPVNDAVPAASAVSVAAVIVAGGHGTRMGGIDKPGLPLGGSTLRDRAMAAAAAAGLEPIVHVGAETDGGPVAAIRAGLAEIAATSRVPTDIVILAGDLVRPDLVVAALMDAGHTAGRDGTVLVDPGGHPQWLAARYRRSALLAAIDALAAGPRDAALRAVTHELDLALLPVAAGVVADVDTWQDYESAKEQVDD